MLAIDIFSHIQFLIKSRVNAGLRWLMPVILVTQEAAIRRIKVQSQLWQTVGETLSQKRAGGVAQGIDREFKPQYHTHTHTKSRVRWEHSAPHSHSGTHPFPTSATCNVHRSSYTHWLADEQRPYS
jgi:hypothetical protein